MIKPQRLALALAVTLAAVGCSDLDSEGGVETTPGAGEYQELPATVLGIDALRGERWNLASVGRREEGTSYLSKGSKVTIEDLWLIDRASGESVSLLPDRQGEIIDTYFLSGKPGPFGSYRQYSSGTSSQAYSQKDEPAFYLIKVAQGKKQVALYGGTIANKKTLKLGGPFESIVHMDMLGDGQLAVYAKRDEYEIVRVVFDLNTLSKVSERTLAPEI